MKKIIIIIMAFCMLFPITIKADNIDLDDLHSQSVYIYDLDEDNVLYEKASNEIYPIASLTKMMTAIVALENISNLNDKVLVTEEMLEDVPWDASVAMLEAGDKVTYSDLLAGLILPSGADAADILAISTSSSVNNFVKKMNKKAKELGMTNTIFVDASGYSDKNKSTARDLALLVIYASNNSDFLKFFGARTYVTTNKLEYMATLASYSNKLPYDYDYVIGSKTGYTPEAGLTLATIISVNKERLITITLNSDVDEEKTNHLRDLNTIYEEISENYRQNVVYSKGDVIYTLKTKNSKEKEYSVIASKDITKFLSSVYDSSKVSLVYNGVDNIKPFTKLGSKLGAISIMYDGKVIDTMDVLLKSKLHINLGKIVVNGLFYILLFVIIFLVIAIKVYCKVKHKVFRIRIYR